MLGIYRNHVYKNRLTYAILLLCICFFTQLSKLHRWPSVILCSVRVCLRGRRYVETFVCLCHAHALSPNVRRRTRFTNHRTSYPITPSTCLQTAVWITQYHLIRVISMSSCGICSRKAPVIRSNLDMHDPQRSVQLSCYNICAIYACMTPVAGDQVIDLILQLLPRLHVDFPKIDAILGSLRSKSLFLQCTLE